MSTPNMCPWCGIRPIYSGFKHCGRRCATEANKAANGGGGPPKGRGGGGGFAQYNNPGGGGGQRAPFPSPNPGGGGGGQFPNHSGAPLCAYPGCTDPPYDHKSSYCSNVHREQAVTDGHAIGCLMCRKFPKMLNHYCGKMCQQKAFQNAPAILPLETKDPKFADISHQFDISWKHTNKQKPTIKYVYKIVQTQAVWEAYEAYKDKVEARENFLAKRKAPGNECRRWHGTRRNCNLGDDPSNPALCGSTTCPMCSILTTSFKKELTNSSGRSFNRFGIGIYASATSSKSDDYASNSLTSPYKAILLTTIIVGKGKRLTTDDTSLTSAPSGFDSVLGETGNSLNYDEVVVYENAAVVPAWLIVYEK